MSFSPRTSGIALTISSILALGAAANATVDQRATLRPAATHAGVTPDTVTGSETVLGEGGTASANYLGNLADIVGVPIACPTITGEDRDCASETGLPAKAAKDPQVLYAAVGTGAAQIDFINQQSGFDATAASSAPYAQGLFDGYGTASPYGFKPYAGTALETSGAAEDTLDFGAGDAPIPLGPKEGTDFVPPGFSIYADSIADYDNGGSTSGADQTGAGFNANRGPARVVPVIATAISIIFNTTGLTLNSNGTLDLTQNDLCGIFTGVITNWNQTSANPGNQAITIVHRSDGSGSTFLTAYDLSQMCGPANPFTGAGKPSPTDYWNQTGFTQGVGTDSNVLSSSGAVPTDSNAPETVWPNSSTGAKKTSGEIAAVAATTGGIGYVSPSNVLGANTAEAYIENYAGNYEPATGTTVAASFAGTSSGDTNPPGYPVDNQTTTLYFPFPTASAGDALVGYSYGYFYTCYPTRLKDQAAGVKSFFAYESASKTSANAATVATFWNLNGLNSAQLKTLNSNLSFKTAPVTKPTKYVSPVNGATEDYTCTDT
jgi:ABC-type phosphate transport system substrate-binding protein